MISRYTRPEMGRIWEAENRYNKWLQVELVACEAMAEMGLIPKEAYANIREKAAFSVDRIIEIEEETKHDVIAFLTNVAEYVGPDSRYIHLGLTSSDILDTSFALLLREAVDIIVQDACRFMDVLKTKALEHKLTVMVGRSHGIHAEPITFGIKLAVFYSEMKRNLKRLDDAREVISYGKMSGAVGTFANVSPEVEARACGKLGLKPAEVSTQIIQRDRHAQYFTTLAILAGTMEKIAVEIRHLQRTEVLEAEEPFSKGQKGSSAMPHKKNPIGAENITGLARLVRSNCLAALEDMALWHERDISHSSVERVIGPDTTILINYMLNRLSGIISGLVVRPDRMMKNLEMMKGLIYSQQVLTQLAEKGLERQRAYEMVQRNALKVWDQGVDFKDLLCQDEEIRQCMTQEEIESLFDVNRHLKHVDAIFDRVFT
jgi:adenylosuccinate lyase